MPRPPSCRAALALLLLLAGCAAAPPIPVVVPDPGALASAPDLAPEDIVREPWTFNGAPGQLIETPHYRIRTTIRYASVLDRLPIFLEHAYHRYANALAPLPVPRTKLESWIFADRRQWAARTRELLPDQADALQGLGRGGFSTRGMAVLYYIDWRGRTRDTFAIASHEGWHQYTQSTFRDPLPSWLEEGVATWMEGHRYGAESEPEFLPYRNDERRRTLARLVRSRRLIPLEELLERSPQSFLSEDKDRLLHYYAQVWALTLFLVDGDEGRWRPGLAQALADAAEGNLQARLARSPQVIARGGRTRAARLRTGPWVVLAYMTPDLAAFERSYLEFVQGLVSESDWRGGR